MEALSFPYPHQWNLAFILCSHKWVERESCLPCYKWLHSLNHAVVITLGGAGSCSDSDKTGTCLKKRNWLCLLLTYDWAEIKHCWCRLFFYFFCGGWWWSGRSGGACNFGAFFTLFFFFFFFTIILIIVKILYIWIYWRNKEEICNWFLCFADFVLRHEILQSWQTEPLWMTKALCCGDLKKKKISVHAWFVYKTDITVCAWFV